MDILNHSCFFPLVGIKKVKFKYVQCSNYRKGPVIGSRRYPRYRRYDFISCIRFFLYLFHWVHFDRNRLLSWGRDAAFMQLSFNKMCVNLSIWHGNTWSQPAITSKHSTALASSHLPRLPAGHGLIQITLISRNQVQLHTLHRNQQTMGLKRLF